MAKRSKNHIFEQHDRTSSPVVVRGPYSDMMHDIATPKPTPIMGKDQSPMVPIYAPTGLTKGLTK